MKKIKIITTAFAATIAMSATAFATNFTDTVGLNETQLAIPNDSVNRGIIRGMKTAQFVRMVLNRAEQPYNGNDGNGLQP